MIKIDKLLDEVFVSGDVETNGPIPGPHSMWSVGLVAFTLRNGIFHEWEANLLDLPGSADHPKTMEEFWAKEPVAFAACRKDPQLPAEAMQSMKGWCEKISPNKLPVFAAYPAGFDFTFIYWYSVYFLGECPFGFQAFDMKTYMAASRRVPFRHATKRHMPKRWFEGNKHPHIALDDAREQAVLCLAMMREHLSAEIAKANVDQNWSEFCDIMAGRETTNVAV